MEKKDKNKLESPLDSIAARMVTSTIPYLIKEYKRFKLFRFSKKKEFESIINCMNSAIDHYKNESGRFMALNLISESENRNLKSQLEKERKEISHLDQSIESFLTESSDIRIYNAEARDELAINLVKAGYIKITNVEGKRNGLDIVTVTASINVKK